MTITEAVTFDPFADGFNKDPYPQYRRLREAGPVQPTALDAVLLTRWVDVSELLRNRGTSVEDRTGKRGRPGDDDLFNALLLASEDGDVLTDDEISDNIVLLYIAGHETTVNLIGNGTYALLRNRSQMERLRNGTVDDAAAVKNSSASIARCSSPAAASSSISRSMATPWTRANT
ncbi:MAG: cytochrome P450 [Acidimicrobiales bacterium]